MGEIILIISITVEVTFAIYCIIKKSNQTKIRSLLRIGVFVVFVLANISGILQWGFRYILLGIVLLILAVIGIIKLLQKPKEEKKYSRNKICIKGIFLSSLLVFVTLPAIIFPQYAPIIPKGEYEVATVTYTYVDENRMETYSDEYRSVNVQFWYPENANEKYPLIIFSHGSYGIKESNYSTYMELASNGYVVCSIDHPYHSLYTKSEDGKIVFVDKGFVQYITDMNQGVYDEATQIQLNREITMLRVEDMSFVIDTAISDAESKNTDEVYQLIDYDKIGAFGHSLGGAAAVELGRQRGDVGAVINLDGDLLCEYLGYDDGEVLINEEIYTTPLLNIWSDTMMDAVAEDDQVAILPHEYIEDTASEAYNMHIIDTNHFSFTDLSLVSPFLVKMIMGSISSNSETERDASEVLEEMNGIILDFFNSYLKNDGEFSLADYDCSGSLTDQQLKGAAQNFELAYRTNGSSAFVTLAEN